MQCPLSLNVSNPPSLPSDYQYMILCENSPLHSLNYNFTELRSYLQGVLRKDIQEETSLKVQGHHTVPQTIKSYFSVAIQFAPAVLISLQHLVYPYKKETA